MGTKIIYQGLFHSDSKPILQPDLANRDPKLNNKLQVTEEETSNFLYNKNLPRFKQPQQTCLEKFQRVQIVPQKQEQQLKGVFNGKYIRESVSQQQSSDQSQFKAQQSFQSDQENFSSEKKEGRNKSSKKKKNKNITRSAHHNSQKHAVVTIKAMVKFQYYGQKNVSSVAAQKIWTNFVQTKRKNKGILNILFGTKGDNPRELQQLLNQYNFKQLLSYSYEQIKKAQEILREMVINQVTSQTLQNNLKNRRIANKKQFREYMINFIGELKEGPIRRRILKEVSSKITQFVQVDKYLNENSFLDLKF